MAGISEWAWVSARSKIIEIIEINKNNTLLLLKNLEMLIFIVRNSKIKEKMYA